MTCYGVNQIFPGPSAVRPSCALPRIIVAGRVGGLLKHTAMIKPRSDDKTIASFWKRVEIRAENECWIWNGARRATGYGVLTFRGKSILAHRFSAFLKLGKLSPGLMICHRCDTPLCVNPNHLWEGTGADNVRDMYEKGRNVTFVGSKNGSAILSEKDVIEIRNKYRRVRGMMSSIAAEYGVTRTTVDMLLKGRTWSHLPVTESRGKWIGPYMSKPFSHGKKLVPELVKAIRSDARNGLNYCQIGRKYSIDPSTATAIVKHKIWKHVT